MVYWWQCVFEGDVAKAMLFLKNNIDMHLTHNHRQTAVHNVCQGGSTTGHVHLLKLLLGRGANPNAIDDSENTPLHMVAYGGYTTMCRILLKAGANIRCYNLRCRRPVDVARHWKRRNVYEMLATWSAANHWRQWTRRRKRQRERRYLLKVWYHKGISCDFRYLVCWL
jgi:ankyrin repeat protein